MSDSFLTFNPQSYVGSGHTFCCASLGGELDARDPGHATYFLRTKRPPPCRVRRPLPVQALNNLGFRLARRGLTQRMEARFLRDAARRSEEHGSPPAALLWPGVSLDLVCRLKAAGVRTALQMINTHAGYAKAIVDAEYDALGVRNPDPISESVVLHERALLDAVDVVLAPSQPVIRSLRAIDVDLGKILLAPFGCDPSRFSGRPRRSGGLTVLFCGSICVRKGAHLLLRAWALSGIEGRLVLCGKMEPTIADRFGDLLGRPDVTVLPFMRDVVSVYRDADLFAFPTLEEGAPLVIYEAASMGLPILTTEMGACALVQEGLNGHLIDAHDTRNWVAALRRLAESRELRQVYGEASRRAAIAKTWAQAVDARIVGLSASAAALS